ncbi:hypothetical protein LC55x_4731 [Lysobacter capsici]|nr:hypothetical protein LC55x_4731 [Lysobacter capsici]
MARGRGCAHARRGRVCAHRAAVGTRPGRLADSPRAETGILSA